MNPVALCNICNTPIALTSQCKCPNRLTVNGSGEVKAETKNFTRVDVNGISITTLVPAVESKTFISLFDKPLIIVNATGQTLGKIQPSGHPVVQNSLCELTYEFEFAAPVPILGISIKSIAFEIPKTAKDAKIICDSYTALLLIKSGYTNIYTPDSSAVGHVSAMICKRLVRFLT